MKKVITLWVAAMFLVATSMSAQTSVPAAKKEVKKEVKKADKKADDKMAKGKDAVKKTPPPPPPAKKDAVKKDVKAAPAPAVAAGQHLKKDGTPDKRFKENKGTPAKHLKKDGTPDMRYKENKK